MSRHSRSDRREILLLRKRFDLGSFRGSRVRYERGVCRTCRETSTASSAALPHVPPPGERRSGIAEVYEDVRVMVRWREADVNCNVCVVVASSSDTSWSTGMESTELNYTGETPYSTNRI